MSSERKDFIRAQLLAYDNCAPLNGRITAVQSQALPANLPAITVVDTTSIPIVNHLPPEAQSEGRELEFFVVQASGSGTYQLKDLSGNTVTAATSGYAKAVCLKGVWRGFKV